MSDVEFEENTFASEAVQRRIEESKPKLGPIYTRIFLAVIFISLSVSAVILFRAFNAPRVDPEAFRKSYEIGTGTQPVNQ